MNIRFDPAFLPLFDAAALITRVYNAQFDGGEESVDTYFGEFAKKHQLPESAFASYTEPLRALERDVMESISFLDDDRMDFFFRLDDKQSCRQSPATAISYYFSFPDQCTDREETRLYLSSACLPSEDTERFPTKEALFAALESPASPYSDRLRWRTFLLYQHFFDYAKELRPVLEAASNVYEHHRSFIDAAIQNAFSRMKEKLGDRPAEMLSVHYHFTADFDELVVRPMIGEFHSLSFFSNFTNDFFLGIYVDLIIDLKAAHSADFDAFADPLKAIDDKNRFQILLALAKGPLCGQDLCAMLDLSPATISHHMNLLIGANFVSIEKIGTRIYYQYKPDSMQAFLSSLTEALATEK